MIKNKVDICILIRLNIALIAFISITKDYYHLKKYIYDYYFLFFKFKLHEHTLRCVFEKVFCCCLFSFLKIHVITFFFYLSMPFCVPFFTVTFLPVLFCPVPLLL